MKCFVCHEEKYGQSAFSLLGFAVCSDCKELMVQVSPQQTEYDCLIEAVRDVWLHHLAGRTWDELLQESSAGG